MKMYAYAFCCLLGMNSVQAETDCPELIQPETPFAVNTTTRTYSDLAPQDRHELDVYWAEDANNAKVVLFIPGGGWVTGDKCGYQEVGFTLAGYYGLTTVIANYRLSDFMPGNEHPMHMRDVAAAFAWLKHREPGQVANIADYGGDPDAIYLFGQSAGGHLVSLLATDPKYLQAVGYSPADIRGVVSLGGIYDLPALAKYPRNPFSFGVQEVVLYRLMFFQAFGGWAPKTLLGPSPQFHISSRQPDFLVAYSYLDAPGLAEEATRFVDAVQTLTPTPSISLHEIQRSDYSDATWELAVEMAESQVVLADYPGHYAEVAAINTSEPDSYATHLVVDFVNSH